MSGRLDPEDGAEEGFERRWEGTRGDLQEAKTDVQGDGIGTWKFGTRTTDYVDTRWRPQKRSRPSPGPRDAGQGGGAPARFVT